MLTTSRTPNTAWHRLNNAQDTHIVTESWLLHLKSSEVKTRDDMLLNVAKYSRRI